MWRNFKTWHNLNHPLKKKKQDNTDSITQIPSISSRGDGIHSTALIGKHSHFSVQHRFHISHFSVHFSVQHSRDSKSRKHNRITA
jgi:hypothetical protein